MCSSCGAEKAGSETTIPAKGHNYVVTTITSATCGTDGKSAEKCSCGDIKAGTETVIPATGVHSYNDSGVCSSCGDTNGPVAVPPATDTPSDPPADEPAA